MANNAFNSLREFKLKSGKTGKYYSLAALEEAGTEPEGADTELIAQLNDHADGKDGGGVPAAAAPPLAAASAPVSSEPVPDEHGFVPVPAHKTADVAAAVTSPAPDEHGFVPVPAHKTAELTPPPPVRRLPPQPRPSRKARQRQSPRWPTSPCVSMLMCWKV